MYDSEKSFFSLNKTVKKAYNFMLDLNRSNLLPQGHNFFRKKCGMEPKNKIRPPPLAFAD